MAISIKEIESKLSEIAGLVPLPSPIENSLLFRFPTKRYVNPESGEQLLIILVKVVENGEYIEIMAPMALKAKGRHKDALLKACMMVQWKTKLIQFEYDDDDGEIRPIVEWPIEDGTVTTKQLVRAIAGLASLVETYYPVLDLAARKGKIDFNLKG